MIRRAGLLLAVLLCAGARPAAAQPVGPPTPLLPASPAGPPPSIEPEPLPPLPAAPETPRPERPPPAPAMPGAPPAYQPPSMAPSPPVGTSGPQRERVFCQQDVAYRLADPTATPERYRRFLGIWSDAAWTPQLCAALIVESVQPDGTAAIVYVVGPMGASARGPGGVLRGTGIIDGGALKFQNSDGSQFEFRPFYADLAGRLTTPQGQSLQAVFKKNL